MKREKEKEKKKENEIKRKEDEQKDRFLKLSDREKVRMRNHYFDITFPLHLFQRALAAERRILDQSGKVIVRCFQCATDISGKVPFEYMTNVFCTITCLKTHRMQNS